ncbi:hypothetical protein [Acetobacter orleanensis]|uniref:Uncharacterized protein n=1 Tax=Acetobacter orleanensis TaxID=104099 RepID=A0A4Y3TPU4_9PROT|nr:hypothetical protein [Acetobacter orleanensis]KXV65601.1 hypothetical protein AD949_04420 [Acetobacter orleanensis]PCD79135.1 hypothetical protein CO710_09055 [Acetobacter orleanensis]GAN67740.1 hypothetical protein Abol_010_056 [Acetobacter orleanensis JCM 7639]GBR22101.1 hypothetical protein AA0473_0034 [Acetobacter orleanensis NRIC 0473]GEB83077.1 hypothetical protein AOR01nite_15540 [Acetobacter orleanensis]
MQKQVRAARFLQAQIFEELTTPVSSAVLDFVEQMVGTANPLGVLFYGSGLRGGIQADTLLDFYVIVRKQSDWPRGRVACLANALLPPNVEYHELRVEGQSLRAKVAILTLAQFRRLTGFSAFDTTVWARFSQPVRLVWQRDAAAAQTLCRCVMRATVTAARWTAFLGPERGPREAFWNALYRQTYQTELRVEKTGRGAGIVARYEDRYKDLLLPCWQIAAVAYEREGEDVRPMISPAQKLREERAWQVRRRLGRPLNILRLIKAAYTFTGGARYAAWKIERHSGIKVPLTPFAEKHPLLAAPPLVWWLWRKGAFRRS